MALSRLNDGDAVDKDLLNKLIDQLNKLESANNFQAIYNFAGTLSTKGDSLLLQGGWQNIPSTGYGVVVAQINYPVAFLNAGMIVCSAHAPGDHLAGYTATVYEASNAWFKVAVERKNSAAVGNVSFHWHALGPVNPSSII